MSYKTILVHVDRTPHLADRLAIAAALAERDDGHLVCAAMTGVSRYLYHNETVDEQDPHLALHLNYLREQAQAALAACAPQLAQARLRSCERRVIDDDAATGLSLHARCADLVVIGQNDPQRAAPAILGDLPGHVVMHAGRPVLLVPYAGLAGNVNGNGAGVGRHILIGWDGGKEAARAVTAALPLLQRAAHVHLAIFDEEPGGPAGEQAGADIAQYLARHGVASETVVRHVKRQGLFTQSPAIGDAMLGLAAELGCDLLVLGAYGHSRLRETLLGGVTRNVLAATTLPVLMAH
ncbi:universal stress protein [Rugamonas sp.]|uniref:universal stress protein n=1 Tax=Rugamonas sp. TaxID=1926287 RepID=UPI0025FB78F5|nr:universal stress protein [Rugamonas sp.]